MSRSFLPMLLCAPPCPVWPPPRPPSSPMASSATRSAPGRATPRATPAPPASTSAATGVRATEDTKWRFGGKALWTRSDGSTTAENILLGTQYDKDFDPRWFGFGKAEALRDKFANISSRLSLYGGVGRHLVKSDTTTFDVSAGLGYTEDRYVNPAVVDGSLRTRFGRAELLLAEESTHQLTATTSVRQKFSLFPALRSGGGYRGVFDSGLAVSMTPTLSLTMGLSYRYDSDPGAGLKKGDTLFVTGVSIKLD